MKIVVAATLALTFVALPAFAASPAGNCTFATPTVAATYAEVPAAIRAKIGPMSERGGPFQVTDVHRRR